MPGAYEMLMYLIGVPGRRLLDLYNDYQTLFNLAFVVGLILLRSRPGRVLVSWLGRARGRNSVCPVVIRGRRAGGAA